MQGFLKNQSQEVLKEVQGWLDGAREVLSSSPLCTRTGGGPIEKDLDSVLAKVLPATTEAGGDTSSEVAGLLRLQSTLARFGVQLDEFHAPSSLRLAALAAGTADAAAQQQARAL